MIKRFDQYNEEFWPLPVAENATPTAEEFIPDDNLFFIDAYGQGDETCLLKSDVSKIMIEFAKLHVTAALEAAAKCLESEYPNPSINKNLTECYPITNIK